MLQCLVHWSWCTKQGEEEKRTSQTPLKLEESFFLWKQLPFFLHYVIALCCLCAEHNLLMFSFTLALFVLWFQLVFALPGGLNSWPQFVTDRDALQGRGSPGRDDPCVICCTRQMQFCTRWPPENLCVLSPVNRAHTQMHTHLNSHKAMVQTICLKNMLHNRSFQLKSDWLQTQPD